MPLADDCGSGVGVAAAQRQLAGFLQPALVLHVRRHARLVEGAWGERGAKSGEWLRQMVDLEHWGAFSASFDRVAEMVDETFVLTFENE